MKIIDLLNKIAKGEEVPKKISINGGIHGIDVWKYDENCKDYLNSHDILLLYSGMTSNHLTDEVEVLEEVEDKEYEDIEELEQVFTFEDCTDELTISNFEKAVISRKINALIRNQKYILERLDKNERSK